MSDIITLLSTVLDLRKRGNTCNIPQCEKMPVKEMVLIEHDKLKQRKREIATVYFCSDHCDKKPDEIVRRANVVAGKGKIIDKKVFDIGYITY
ncbi:MAG: hypothetical protein ABIJ92_05080 [Candidatus Aenigmatarchaeota archaeon]